MKSHEASSWSGWDPLTPIQRIYECALARMREKEPRQPMTLFVAIPILMTLSLPLALACCPSEKEPWEL